MKSGIPFVRAAPAGVILGGQARAIPRAGLRAQASPLRGWLWLLLGVGSALLWTHTLSFNSGVGGILHWLPALAILAGLRFIWLNRSRRGLWLLAAGAGCNLLVMGANGGLMPISPSSAGALGLPVQQANHVGVVLSRSKDRVIPDSQARFAYLDDRLVFKVGDRTTAASVGDGIVALGCLVTLLEELAGLPGPRTPEIGAARVERVRRRLHGI